MNLINLILTLSAFFATALCQSPLFTNTSQEYHLKTKLKPGQAGKQRFDGLYLESYHTGAGLDDAVTVKASYTHSLRQFDQIANMKCLNRATNTHQRVS